MILAWRLAWCLASPFSPFVGTAGAKPTRLDETRAAEQKPLPAEAGMDWKGQLGGRTTPGHAEARDPKAWRALWIELGLDPPPPPDFSKLAAVAVYLGEKPTGGWTLEFLPPRRDGDDLIVRYRVLEPTGLSTQAFTQPWRVHLFPTPPGKLVVVRAEMRRKR